MNFRNVGNYYTGKFTKLCLLLFPYYRSAKLTKNGKVIFWRRGFSLFDNRVVIPYEDLIYKYIPLQLSMYKWGSWTRYSDYVADIHSIMESNQSTVEKVKDVNKWFINEIHETATMNLHLPFISINRVIVRRNGNITSKPLSIKKANRISIRDDIIDPCIKRIKEFDLSAMISSGRYALTAAMVALFIHINIMYNPLGVRRFEFPTFETRDIITEELFIVPTIEGTSTALIQQNNNIKKTFFDSS